MQLSFAPSKPENMSEIWPYMKREIGRTCDFSFGGFLMWIDVFDYKYIIVEDTLFISGKVEDDLSRLSFSLPVGHLPISESIRILQDYCKNNNIQLVLSAIPEYAIADLVNCGAKNVKELEGWGDYLYDAKQLSLLQGKKMSKKRNHVNQFINKYGNDCFEPMTTANIDDAIRFMDSYSTQKSMSSTSAAVENMLTQRLLEVMKTFDTPLIGGLLRINDRVEAITIGDIKNDTLYIHVEKANREIPGVYEMINKSFASYVCENFPQIAYINREDDSGDEGLKKAKESYHPITILKKYNVTF